MGTRIPHSRSKRGAGYSQAETDSLLDLLEEHIPLSSMEWENIERLHKCRFPTEDRTCESLKWKFQELYRTKPATGSSFIPNDVRQANAILKMMQERTNSSDCEGDDNNESDDEESKKEEETPQPDVDEKSTSALETWACTMGPNAKPLAKVPLLLSTRK